jgi:hypothetical protein
VLKEWLGSSWLLFIRCGRDEPKTELLSKNEPELQDSEMSQAIHIAKYENGCSGEKLRVWLDNHSMKGSP